MLYLLYIVCWCRKVYAIKTPQKVKLRKNMRRIHSAKVGYSRRTSSISRGNKIFSPCRKLSHINTLKDMYLYFPLEDRKFVETSKANEHFHNLRGEVWARACPNYFQNVQKHTLCNYSFKASIDFSLDVAQI